jgi:hypothetical protein
LVGENCKATLAVYEMIAAANREDTLKPIIRELDGHLADLLVSYVGTKAAALLMSGLFIAMFVSRRGAPARAW